MPYYLCRIAGEDGRVVSRSVLATAAQECRRTFEAQGLLVLSVRRDWNKLGNLGLGLGRKVKDRDIILFNQELVAMIKAGYPILKSLESISGRVKNVHLREILIDVAGEVKKGKALSEAFLPYEKVFTPIYTASLMAGEKGGNLPSSIGRYIQYAKMVTQTRSRIKSAMTYPTILIVFSFILMGLLMNFVIPQFASFYTSFQSELPGITRFVMSVSTTLSRHWYIMAAVFVAALGAFIRLRRRPDFRYRIDRIKLRVPFGKTIWLESGVSLFSRTLGLLLEAGISLLAAIGTIVAPNACSCARVSADMSPQISVDGTAAINSGSPRRERRSSCIWPRMTCGPKSRSARSRIMRTPASHMKWSLRRAAPSPDRRKR